MAEFGTKATELSAPTGAGSSPVSPVQQAAVNTFPGALLETVGNIFAKGLERNAKEEAERRKNGVLGSYSKELGGINDALSSGQISAAEASVRTKAINNKYGANFAEYIPDLQKAASYFNGETEIGTAQKEIEAENKRWESDISFAQSRGKTFFPGMSKEQIIRDVKAAKTAYMMEESTKARYRENEERRAQGNYDMKVAEKEEKEASWREVNMVAADELESFRGFGKELGDKVRAGQLPFEDAQLRLKERFSNIETALVSAARTNPELANAYRSVFGGMNELFVKHLDSKTAVENLDDQLKLKVTKLKLIAMSDPKTAALAVTNQLIPGNLALQASKQGYEAFKQLAGGDIDADEPTYQPDVIRNPEVNKDHINLLTKSVDVVRNNSAENPELAKKQMTRVADRTLKQIGQLVSQVPANSKEVEQRTKDLAMYATFFASPEYAYLVQNNLISRDAAQAANRTFQLQYEDVIIRGVQTKLQGQYTQNEGGKTTAVPLMNNVNIKFSGSGVIFEPKGYEKASVFTRTQLGRSLAELQSSTKYLNQLVHMGAHMEGHTNYAKHWEDNKHRYLPNVFPDPNKLKPGTVVDGYKYVGGAYNDRSNWTKVN